MKFMGTDGGECWAGKDRRLASSVPPAKRKRLARDYAFITLMDADPVRWTPATLAFVFGGTRQHVARRVAAMRTALDTVRRFADAD